METAEEPDTTSQTGRQMVCYKEETNELETAREKFFSLSIYCNVNIFKFFNCSEIV